jgi:hypothetical protein
VHKTASLVCLALAALLSCSRQKPLSRDELQSKLRSAESIAAETGTFIDYVQHGRATNPYATGHIEYLSSELSRIAKELHDSLPPADASAQFADGSRQVDALAAALSDLRSHIRQSNELAREQEQVARMRNALQRAVSAL